MNNECLFETSTKGATGYGDWTKAPPVRDIVESVRSLTVGFGKRRKVGAVRGSDTPTPLPQWHDRCLNQQRENVVGVHVSKVEAGSL